MCILKLIFVKEKIPEIKKWFPIFPIYVTSFRKKLNFTTEKMEHRMGKNRKTPPILALKSP